MKVALISGITGQDGSFLAEFLLQKGYEIPVIEAAQAAVMLLELEARMRLKQSRITYMRPPER